MKPYVVKYSWQRIAQTPQFHFFGVRTHPNPSTGLGGNVAYVRPDIDELLFDVNHNSAGVNDDLDRIFSGEWASMFATVSPDEDFIETYKLSVLATAQTPLGSLVVSLPSGQSVDIIKDLFINSGTTLYKKAQSITAPCF